MDILRLARESHDLDEVIERYQKIINREETPSNAVYFTITGTWFYHGSEFLKPGMNVRLTREPDNRHDNEAIRVEVPGLGKCGQQHQDRHR